MGAAQGGLQAAGTGNPYLIAGNTALQGLLGGMSGQADFDPAPFLNQFRDYKESVLADLGNQTRDITSGVNSDLASRGLQHSPMGAGIVAGTDTALRTSALRQLRDQEYNLNMQLSRADLANERQQKVGDQAALRALIGDVGNVAADVITGDQSTQPGIRGIREILGMPTAKMVGEEALAGDVPSIIDQLRREHGENLGIPSRVRSEGGYPIHPDDPFPELRTPDDPINLPSPEGVPSTHDPFPHLRQQQSEDPFPELRTPADAEAPTGINQSGETDELDLMDLDLPMSEDMFQLVSNTGTNANMIEIQGTGLAVPADSSFGKVYQKYKPRFDLLAEQLSGGLTEFIEAFTMPAQILKDLEGNENYINRYLRKNPPTAPDGQFYLCLLYTSPSPRDS